MKQEGKIWGKTQQIEMNDCFEMHRIEFKADHQCSEHYHKPKSNGFLVESGQLMIRVWPEEGSDIVDNTILSAGDYMAVPAGVWHQFVGIRDGVAFELYWSEFNSEDIVRRTTGSFIGVPSEAKGEQQDLNWDGN